MEDSSARKTITRSDPAWVRPAFLGLLGATAVLYLWNLAASGWANAYYSAAALGGAKGWGALFFGALAGSNLIPVGQAPGPLWALGIPRRGFGFNARAGRRPRAPGG